MARDYKAEYARRIARGLAQGKTRQQARGHVVKEHIVRRQRSIVRYGVTPYQRRRQKQPDNFDKPIPLRSHIKHEMVYNFAYQGVGTVHYSDGSKERRFSPSIDYAERPTLRQLHGDIADAILAQFLTVEGRKKKYKRKPGSKDEDEQEDVEEEEPSDEPDVDFIDNIFVVQAWRQA